MQEAHQPQGGDAEASTNSFAVGDKVSYVKVSSSGTGFRFSARDGVITELNDQVATVRARNGRTTTMHIKELTPVGQPNALTRALMGDR
ncbi:MAG: hypothetical protein NDI93_01445 [Pseudomonas sp.]|nr:hypothetical protein [Pseudomonas sp.]